MANPMRASGIVLLIGAVLLSLNVFSAMALPDMTAPPVKSDVASPPSGDATPPGIHTRDLGASIEASGLPPVPVLASERGPAVAIVQNPIAGPSVFPGSGILAPFVTPQPIPSVSPGSGIYPPSAAPGSTSPVVPGPGLYPPVLHPAPVPPIVPGPGKLSPGPSPPYEVEPVPPGH